MINLRKLQCFSINSKSSTSSSLSSPFPNPSQGNSQLCVTDNNSTPNISNEYNFTVSTNSFTDIRSEIQAIPQLLIHLLHPNQETVQEALRNTKTTTHTRLISNYFDHSETASTLCLNLLQHAQLARATYAALIPLFQNPNLAAFSLFLNFDAQHNPLPSSHTFAEIRASLSQLKLQLDRRRLRKYRIFRSIPDRRRRVQLDATAKCVYVLNNDLGTIDRLVARLRAAVDGDKDLVRVGLESGIERFPVEHVVKEISKSYASFVDQLEDLEEHVCLCFYTVNKARTLLLQQICTSFP